MTNTRPDEVGPCGEERGKGGHQQVECRQLLPEAFGAPGLGFRAWGLGLRVEGSGCRVSG